MSKRSMSLLHQKSKSRSPVEDTVRSHWGDVLAGASNGHTRADIRRVFQDAGLEVGSPAGFNAALARVAAATGVSLDDLISGSAKPEPEAATDLRESAAAPVARQQTDADQCPPATNTGSAEPPSEQLSTFIDPRYTSNF